MSRLGLSLWVQAKPCKNEQHIGSIGDLRPFKISNKLTFKLQRTTNKYAAKRRRRAEEPQKGRNSCLRLTPGSVFGSFSVVLMSSKVNFHVVRSALQNYSGYIFAGQVFYRSYVLRNIRLRSIFCLVLPMFPRLVLSILYFLCETSTWHLDSRPLGDTWYGVVQGVFKFNARALKQSVREFYGRASLFVAPYWGVLKRAKQLFTATTPLCFWFFRCRVDVLQS